MSTMPSSALPQYGHVRMGLPASSDEVPTRAGLLAAVVVDAGAGAGAGAGAAVEVEVEVEVEVKVGAGAVEEEKALEPGEAGDGRDRASTCAMASVRSSALPGRRARPGESKDASRSLLAPLAELLPASLPPLSLRSSSVSLAASESPAASWAGRARCALGFCSGHRLWVTGPV